MKKHIATVTSLSLCLIAAPFTARSEDATASPTPAQSVTPEKHHRDINKFLDRHPKLKEKILAKFDTNHNGKLDGDEIEAFRKWRKEHREEMRDKHHKNGEETTSDTSPSASSDVRGASIPQNRATVGGSC